MSKVALNLFLSCHSPNPQWEFGFSGRGGIPDERIERRAARLGIETNDVILEKVDECIAVVREWDAKQNAPKET